MKIALSHHYSTIVGGAEHAVRSSFLELLERGHELIFLYEAADASGDAIAEGKQARCIHLSPDNREAVLSQLREWAPDLVYNHGLQDASNLALLQTVAPTISYVHDYVGQCISGTKLHHFPQYSLCTRRFGAGCLVHYLPRRCGGLNPSTMMALYDQNEAMRRVLMRNDALLVASEHMANEWRRMGFPSDRLFVVAPFCGDPPASINPLEYLGKVPPLLGEEIRLGFLGRMEPLKGGSTLLAALPSVQKALKAPLRLTLAGDGRSRADWERQAARLMAANSQIKVEFPGLINAEQRDQMLAGIHALVMPSVWPEPFGQVGVQALMSGSPAIAFNSGGAPDWLQHGINGLLADANPPCARSLAKTIVEVFADTNRFRRMSAAATRTSGRFVKSVHLLKLDAAFAATLQRPRPLLN